MEGIINFETFLFTGILLNITPGNDTIFILSKSMAEGKKAGIVSALGIGTGAVIHTLLAAFGLSIIISKSILVFNIIKYAGAAYLLYLGYKMITSREALNMTKDVARGIDLGKIYRDAVLTNVSNPKVALFFIAFLPQFIDPQLKSTIIPFISLGLTFTTTATIWCLLLANFSSLLFSKLKTSPNVTNVINKISGFALIASGIKVAVSK